ncbi:MAG TPA: response regulator transcription factor [Dehalococcoidia bacterium]|nr:response regulator transcription factor [Dehalococcoidia bacterium]
MKQAGALPDADHQGAAVRLLISTQHVLLAEGIRSLAHERPGIVTRVACEERALTDALQSWAPTVVLVDAISRVQRIADATMLNGAGSEPAVVVLAPDEPVQIEVALLAGARGFIPHGASAGSLFACIEAVSRGEWGLPRNFVGELVEEYLSRRSDRPALVMPLEARERQILELFAGGMSAAKIGDCLFLSESAIRTELRILKRKFGATSRARLVALALRNGVVPQSEPPAAAWDRSEAGPDAAAL